ncbi:MAG: hypothetical protein WBQ11_00665, partial [Isosphaeraceae bacterium]
QSLYHTSQQGLFPGLAWFVRRHYRDRGKPVNLAIQGLDRAGVRNETADAEQKISQDGQVPEQLTRCFHHLLRNSENPANKTAGSNVCLKQMFETSKIKVLCGSTGVQ